MGSLPLLTYRTSFTSPPFSWAVDSGTSLPFPVDHCAPTNERRHGRGCSLSCGDCPLDLALNFEESMKTRTQNAANHRSWHFHAGVAGVQAPAPSGKSGQSGLQQQPGQQLIPAWSLMRRQQAGVQPWGFHLREPLIARKSG
jgi:hypothetical protein